MMKRFLLSLLPLTLIAAKQEAPVDPGPQPSRADAIAMGESAIRARMIDPDSARIQWPYGFTGGWIKAALGRKHVGWFTCGTVNAKNRMGGYTGDTWFLLLINNGQIASLEIGDANMDLTGCANMVNKGTLQRAMSQTMPTAEQMSVLSQQAAQKGKVGIAYSQTAFGAMILQVAAGTPADRAGLKQAEVIEAINGISIKGMSPESVGAVFSGVTLPVTLKIVGVGDVKVLP